VTDVCPYQPDPYILDNISYSHELEPCCRILGSGFNAALIFKPAARFNAETSPVSLVNSSLTDRRLAYGIGKVFNPVFSVLSFAVCADYPYIERDDAVIPTTEQRQISLVFNSFLNDKWATNTKRDTLLQIL